MNKSNRAFVLLAALVLAVFLAGCTLPPYNEELSLAQVTRSKLGQPLNKIGPIYYYLEENAKQNQYYFLPDRDDPANSGGFLVATTSYGLRVWYLADGSTSLESSWSIDLANSSDTSNNYLLEPIESAADFNLSLTRYAQNDLRVITATSTTSISQSVGPTSLPTAFSLGVTGVLGSGIFPYSTSTTYDLQYFLCTAGVGTFYEFIRETSATAGIVAIGNGLVTGLGPAPADLTNAFYHHNPTVDKSYLSYWSSSSKDYVSYSWTWDTQNLALAASDFQQLTGVKGRIEAVLSNGQFLAIDEGACTVYGTAGNKLYKFPLGGLKFCYERWDSTESRFKLYFSLAYWIFGYEEKSDQLRVEVYAIPTDNLKNLN